MDVGVPPKVPAPRPHSGLTPLTEGEDSKHIPKRSNAVAKPVTGLYRVILSSMVLAMAAILVGLLAFSPILEDVHARILAEQHFLSRVEAVVQSATSVVDQFGLTLADWNGMRISRSEAIAVIRSGTQ